MKTVRDACVLRANALEIRVSDQIEQLDQLIEAQGEGSEFFDRTHITQGMKDLITEGMARLAGRSNQAVFHLKQAMGGGKTHMLIAFGLLAKYPSLRKKYCSFATYSDEFGECRICAFNGRNNPDHYFWGEIANQLGKPEEFKRFWAEGPKAPDESAWLKLFEEDRPILILLDEMPPYFQIYETQQMGRGTVADIVTRAFANMLTAAWKRRNVCIVISDLSAAYDTGGRLINRALRDAQQEVGRQERSITPVDLTTNEVYEILRKRLFESLPDTSVIDEIAAQYAKKLSEAVKAKTILRGAEAIADEIAETYPFHPRLKNLIALFKENEQFKQTRGLLELTSRLLKSVWERDANDVFLIGAQHFDLSIPEVRDKLTEISGMRDVIACDIWDINYSAHAQIIDLSSGKDTAKQVATLILTASLSTAVNAVKGLTKEEMIECLLTPWHEPSDFLKAFDELEKVAWYLHHSPEGRYYFDRIENLTKLLERLAKDAPQPQVEELIRNRLNQMFKPNRRSVYDVVLPLPQLTDISERIRRSRVLIIVSPDSPSSFEEVKRLFSEITQKNNLCVLTGEKTAMASIEDAARKVFACHKAREIYIPLNHPQRDDLERRLERYEQDFTSIILNLFDKVVFPIQRPGREPQLASKPLDMTRDTSKPFNGEEQIEKTLSSDPVKLYLDIEQNFDSIRVKAEEVLWPQNQDEARWSDVADRYCEDPRMPWLPQRGLDELKRIALNRGLWEDLGNGYITRRPKKKTTSVQVIVEGEMGDDGSVKLRVNPINAGPTPRIHYAEDAEVSERSPILRDNILKTSALKVGFLVVDPSQQYDTGEPYYWTNKLVIRNHLIEKGDKRYVELFVKPRGQIRYTLDGSEPRNGISYTEPFDIPDSEVLVRVFAEAEGIEAKEDFRFPSRDGAGIQLDPARPASITSKYTVKMDSRPKAFQSLMEAREKKIFFENVMITIGQGSKVASLTFGELQVEAEFLLRLLEEITDKFLPDAPVTFSFKKAVFKSGFDLKEFCEKLNIPLNQLNVEQ